MGFIGYFFWFGIKFTGPSSYYKITYGICLLILVFALLLLSGPLAALVLVPSILSGPTIESPI